MAKKARDPQTDGPDTDDTTDGDPTAARVADLERGIRELEVVHEEMRAVITERGGVVPLDVTGHDGRPVPFRAKLREVESELSRRRMMLAAAHRGHVDKPRDGETFYVTAIPRPGAKQRGRRGLRFEHGVRRKVVVVEQSDVEVARMVQNGESVVSPDGMLEILSDPDLLATQSATDDTAAAIRNERDSAIAERDSARAELAALKAAARRNAPESTDGSPARLKAAAKAGQDAKEPDKG